MLQSTDARIAEAAKRVFSLSSSYPTAMSAYPEASSNLSSGSVGDEQSPYDYLTEQAQDGDHDMGTSSQNGAGGAKHTANITDFSFENTTSNEDIIDNFQEGDKKLSSKERLQRR